MATGKNFSANEKALIASLNSPLKVQRYLDGLVYNHESGGETLRGFRGVLKYKKAHCLEAALFAAVVLECHGYAPKLLDIESADGLDHVVFLFRGPRGWGSVARSRDPGLHGRKPLFKTVRALVRSYMLPYIDSTGRINGFGVFDLAALKRVNWRFSSADLWAVEKALIAFKHQKFNTPAAIYKIWHKRYLEFHAQFPHHKPVYYPGRHLWL